MCNLQDLSRPICELKEGFEGWREFHHLRVQPAIGQGRKQCVSVRPEPRGVNIKGSDKILMDSLDGDPYSSDGLCATCIEANMSREAMMASVMPSLQEHVGLQGTSITT